MYLVCRNKYQRQTVHFPNDAPQYIDTCACQLSVYIKTCVNWKTMFILNTLYIENCVVFTISAVIAIYILKENLWLHTFEIIHNNKLNTIFSTMTNCEGYETKTTSNKNIHCISKWYSSLINLKIVRV